MSRRRGGGTPPPTKTFWQKYQWFIIAGVAMFFVITVVAPALSTPPEDTTQQTNPLATSTTSLPGELFFQASNVDGQAHVPRGARVTTYRSDPPVSGPHWSDANAPISWGVYTQVIPDEVLVHNLEHGGIVIHYRSSADPMIRQQLEEFVQNQPGGTQGFILAPRSNLPATITMSAWEYYLPLFQMNEPSMRNFISAHYDQGPEGLSGGAK